MTACCLDTRLSSAGRTPADLRGLGRDELTLLAAEIRDLLVQTVSRTGGHLGPNLGAVELTIALHRVFDSPTEPILFDVGHQAYVHKILTGRAERMSDAAPDRRRCPATRAGPRARTTGSRTRTPRPRCPTPTGWPRRSRSAASAGRSSRSSATARSPAACAGRR